LLPPWPWWLPFEIPDVPLANFKTRHPLWRGTQFVSVRWELRLLVMDAIERISLHPSGVRLSNGLSSWCFHCHLRRELFKPRWNYEHHCDALKKAEVSRSKGKIHLSPSRIPMMKDLPPFGPW
jgi:hypothetical protein